VDADMQRPAGVPHASHTQQPADTPVCLSCSGDIEVQYAGKLPADTVFGNKGLKKITGEGRGRWDIRERGG
jgi:hypothetical protein